MTVVRLGTTDDVEAAMAVLTDAVAARRGPGGWGEGIGGRLVDDALAEARGRGYDQIQLWTQEANVRARRLYSSRGFVRTERTKLGDHGDEIAFWTRAL